MARLTRQKFAIERAADALVVAQHELLNHAEAADGYSESAAVARTLAGILNTILATVREIGAS